MAFNFRFFFFFSVSFLCIHLSFSAVLAPIIQDLATRHYMLSLYTKTPLQPANFLLDLSASFSWVDCTTNYTSSTHHPIPCGSPLCNMLNSPACFNCSEPTGPVCSKDSSCRLFLTVPRNRKRKITVQALADTLALPGTDGRNPGQLWVVPEFVLSCSKRSLLKGLVPRGVTGLAALGRRSNFSLPAQVSTAFSLPKVFALCMSGSPSAPGVSFFGTSGPYYFLPEIDLSKHLNYTPLLVSNFFCGSTTKLKVHPRPSDEYFIGLTSIKVNGRVVAQLNQTLQTIDENGFGGTKLSVATPYTMLESSIYAHFIEVFVNESAARKLTVTQPLRPFSACYDAADILETRLGPDVPIIDLVLQSDDAFWRIFGSNSMVRIASEGVDVWCLAFVDAGANPQSSIVIGGYQMVDNLLQFDLESNRLGFSSSVLVHETMCANFNFTVNSSLI